MSEFTFQEDQSYTQRNAAPTSNEKGIAGMLVRAGVVKTAGQANIVMIAAMLCFFGLTFYLLFGGGEEQRVLDPSIDPATDLPYGMEMEP